MHTLEWLLAVLGEMDALAGSGRPQSHREKEMRAVLQRLLNEVGERIRRSRGAEIEVVEAPLSSLPAPDEDLAQAPDETLRSEAVKKALEDSETPPADLRRPKTRTLARLLAEQGAIEDAITILESLAEAEPEHAAALQAEIAALRQGPKASAPTATKAEPMLRLSESDGALLVQWEVDDAAVRRAASLLGTAGTLQARIVLTTPDPESGIKQRTLVRDAQTRGAWRLEDIVRGCRVTASVGLASELRFISVAHAPTHVV